MKKDQIVLKKFLGTLTLLCVEKYTTTTVTYGKLFNEVFNEVLFARNAEDGLVICENKKVDVIITAQKFSGMSGLEMVKNIREKDRNISIILVSSFEQTDSLSEILRLKIDSFIKKPFKAIDLLDVVESVAKQLLENKYILEKQEKEIGAFKQKISYCSFQENLSWQKLLKIIRNDYYYKQLKERPNSITIIDFLYRAKDVISGDTYSAREIDESRTLLFIADGMGKGFSASISAMITVIYMNDIIDSSLEGGVDFCLNDSIGKTIKHIKKTLLEDEILSVSLLLVDSANKTLEYALFSMPPILLLNFNGKIKSLKSNNPPISCYTKSFKVDQYSYKRIKKLLIYSDGLVENTLKNEDDTYSKYIKEDFKHSATREEFRKKIMSKIAEPEDDMTFILLNHISLKKPIHVLEIEARLKETQTANEWFEDIVAQKTDDENIQTRSSLAFMELLMNAYEHGSLGIDARQKHTLIENDEYFEYLAQRELTCDKKILIEIYNCKNCLLVKIKDEGDGFDTTSLMTVFGLNKSFNQRGIFMSRNSTLGIYYNKKANQITFIIKL